MWLPLHLSRAFKLRGVPLCWPRKKMCHLVNVFMSLCKTHRKYPFTDLVTARNCQTHTCKAVHGAQLTARKLDVAPWPKDKLSKCKPLSRRLFHCRSSHENASATVQGEGVWPQQMSLYPGYIHTSFNKSWSWLVCSPSPKASRSWTEVKDTLGEMPHATNWYTVPALLHTTGSSANFSCHQQLLQAERTTEMESLICKKSSTEGAKVKSVQRITNFIILNLQAQITSHFRKHRNLFVCSHAHWAESGRKELLFLQKKPTSWSSKELCSPE